MITDDFSVICVVGVGERIFYTHNISAKHGFTLSHGSSTECFNRWGDFAPVYMPEPVIDLYYYWLAYT